MSESPPWNHVHFSPCFVGRLTKVWTPRGPAPPRPGETPALPPVPESSVQVQCASPVAWEQALGREAGSHCWAEEEETCTATTTYGHRPCGVTPFDPHDVQVKGLGTVASQRPYSLEVQSWDHGPFTLTYCLLLPGKLASLLELSPGAVSQGMDLEAESNPNPRQLPGLLWWG